MKSPHLNLSKSQHLRQSNNSLVFWNSFTTNAKHAHLRVMHFHITTTGIISRQGNIVQFYSVLRFIKHTPQTRPLHIYNSQVFFMLFQLRLFHGYRQVPWLMKLIRIPLTVPAQIGYDSPMQHKSVIVLNNKHSVENNVIFYTEVKFDLQNSSVRPGTDVCHKMYTFLRDNRVCHAFEELLRVCIPSNYHCLVKNVLPPDSETTIHYVFWQIKQLE